MLTRTLALRASAGRQAGAAPMPPSATLTTTKAAFLNLSSGLVTPAELTSSGALKVEGDSGVVRQLLGLLDKPASAFPILTR